MNQGRPGGGPRFSGVSPVCGYSDVIMNGAVVSRFRQSQGQYLVSQLTVNRCSVSRITCAPASLSASASPLRPDAFTAGQPPSEGTHSPASHILLFCQRPAVSFRTLQYSMPWSPEGEPVRKFILFTASDHGFGSAEVICCHSRHAIERISFTAVES